MEEMEVYEVEEFKEPKVLESDEDAAWAMRRLRGIVTRQLSNQAVADKEKGRIDAWLQVTNGNLQHAADYFRELLIDYMRREREKNRKSVSLPYGIIKSTARQPKVEPDDEFVSWAEQNAKYLLRYKPAPAPEPNLSEIKERLKKGEQIEHLMIVEGGVSFSVEVK